MHDIFLEFPTIEMQNIRLRQLMLSDVEDFYHFLCNENVQKFLSSEDIPHSLEEAKTELSYWANLYKSFRSIYWAIALKKTNRLIGTCGFNSWNKTHRRAEISYDLSYNYWGHGIMTEVVKEITDFAFAKMGVQRVQATVAEDNFPSIRVLEKCNYQKEGLLANFAILQGKYRNFYMYANVSQA